MLVDAPHERRDREPRLHAQLPRRPGPGRGGRRGHQRLGPRAWAIAGAGARGRHRGRSPAHSTSRSTTPSTPPGRSTRSATWPPCAPDFESAWRDGTSPAPSPRPPRSPASPSPHSLTSPRWTSLGRVGGEPPRIPLGAGADPDARTVRAGRLVMLRTFGSVGADRAHVVRREHLAQHLPRPPSARSRRRRSGRDAAAERDPGVRGWVVAEEPLRPEDLGVRVALRALVGHDDRRPDRGAGRRGPSRRWWRASSGCAPPSG